MKPARTTAVIRAKERDTGRTCSRTSEAPILTAGRHDALADLDAVPLAGHAAGGREVVVLLAVELRPSGDVGAAGPVRLTTLRQSLTTTTTLCPTYRPVLAPTPSTSGFQGINRSLNFSSGVDVRRIQVASIAVVAGVS